MNITAEPDPIEPGEVVTVCLTDVPETDLGPWEIDYVEDQGPGETNEGSFTITRGSHEPADVQCQTWVASETFTGVTFTGPGGIQARVSVAS